MAKIEEITEDTLFTAVLYTDGACAGNPGFYGSGVHGYIYRDEDIEVKNLPTLGTAYHTSASIFIPTRTEFFLNKPL